jgi:hypothetical protein
MYLPILVPHVVAYIWQYLLVCTCISNYIHAMHLVKKELVSNLVTNIGIINFSFNSGHPELICAPPQ